MADKLILEIAVTIDEAEISRFDGPAGGVVMIPFDGTATGEMFNGRVLPGGVDTQRIDVNGILHMSARYMLEGTDRAGAPCKIFVENSAAFPKDAPMPFYTVPVFTTDSPSLAPYLHRQAFRGEGHPRDNGVVIKLFEVLDR